MLSLNDRLFSNSHVIVKRGLREQHQPLGQQPLRQQPQPQPILQNEKKMDQFDFKTTIPPSLFCDYGPHFLNNAVDVELRCTTSSRLKFATCCENCVKMAAGVIVEIFPNKLLREYEFNFKDSFFIK